jgi:hypothetical protein
MMDTKVRRQNPVVTLQMYEVYNELIKDLLQVPGGGSSYCELAESANRGVYVKVGSNQYITVNVGRITIVMKSETEINASIAVLVILVYKIHVD